MKGKLFVGIAVLVLAAVALALMLGSNWVPGKDRVASNWVPGKSATV